jgi:AAA+ superfamily predicted ATPase
MREPSGREAFLAVLESYIEKATEDLRPDLEALRSEIQAMTEREFKRRILQAATLVELTEKSGKI